MNEINLCDKLNVKNYVFHPGVMKNTQKGLQYTLDLINDATLDTKNVTILIENMTGTNKLCQEFVNGSNPIELSIAMGLETIMKLL